MNKHSGSLAKFLIWNLRYSSYIFIYIQKYILQLLSCCCTSKNTIFILRICNIGKMLLLALRHKHLWLVISNVVINSYELNPILADYQYLEKFNLNERTSKITAFIIWMDGTWSDFIALNVTVYLYTIKIQFFTSLKYKK